MAGDKALDDLVRRVDEDRWLASRFAPPDRRQGLMALYALNYEIARTPETVSQDDLGRIRLAWWRGAVAEIYDGKPVRAHPALTAYAVLAREAELPRAPLDALIDAHEKDFDAVPFATWDELDAYVDATAGSVMSLAIAICGGVADELARAGGRAWGYTGLLRAEPIWRARGRSIIPSGGSVEEMRARAKDAHAQARPLVQKLPPAGFPAVGYLAFVPTYLRRLGRGERDAPLWQRQWRMVFATATGGI